MSKNKTAGLILTRMRYGEPLHILNGFKMTDVLVTYEQMDAAMKKVGELTDALEESQGNVQTLAKGLMDAYGEFQNLVDKCPFCGSAIDLDCYYDCVMQVAENVTLESAGDSLPARKWDTKPPAMNVGTMEKPTWWWWRDSDEEGYFGPFAVCVWEAPGGVIWGQTQEDADGGRYVDDFGGEWWPVKIPLPDGDRDT